MGRTSIAASSSRSRNARTTAAHAISHGVATPDARFSQQLPLHQRPKVDIPRKAELAQSTEESDDLQIV
jgi:hypothetical protein